MTAIKASKEPLPPSTSMRKTLSLSTLFRTERAVRSRSSSEAMEEGKSIYDTTVKRIRRLSLKRTPSSSGSTLTSSPCASPKIISSPYACSTSSRVSRVACRSLFIDSPTLEEEDFIPPKRPACPAPLLDLSFEGLSMQDLCDPFQLSRTTRLHSDIMGRLAVSCPSVESFQCRGLQEDVPEYVEAKTPPRSRNRRPTMTQILAPSALKLRAKTSILSMDSDLSLSPTSSTYSFETTPEAADQSTFQLAQSTLRHQTTVLGLLCPASPPPTVRLQMCLPPTASLVRRLTLLVDSNASTLELKELLCSTLLHQFHFSISPSNIALSFVYKDGKPASILENSLPLYQEGLQDDDDIIVRF